MFHAIETVSSLCVINNETPFLASAEVFIVFNKQINDFPQGKTHFV